MIKKIIKPDNYNVAYFPSAVDYALTITKSLELNYYQEEDIELDFSIELKYTSSLVTSTIRAREAWKVIKEISVLSKQIELLTTANQITVSITAKQISVSTSAYAG